MGYRAFSTFLDSDNNFLVFRKFGTLNSRLLLYLQDKIAVAEKELGEIDLHYSKEETGDVNNGSFRQEMIVERVQALERIHLLIKEYSKDPQIKYEALNFLILEDGLLLQYSAICAWPEAPKSNVQSVRNWLHSTKNAIYDEETAYINRSHDLVSLAPKAKSPLRRFFERSSYFRLAKIWKRKPSEDIDFSLPYPGMAYYMDDSRVENFIRFLITVLGMIMLITPLWVLAITHGTMKRLGVITGFIILFLSLVAFTTTARPFESLAATAA